MTPPQRGPAARFTPVKRTRSASPTQATPVDVLPVQRSRSFLHWMLPAMLALIAISVLLSGRDLSRMFAELTTGGGMAMHPALPWIQRAVSLLLLAIAAERLVSQVAMRRHLPAPFLTWAFIAYWMASVAGPSFFGTHPQISHEYFYSLIIGVAGLMAMESDGDAVTATARNALFLFLLAGAVLVPLNPAMVLDSSYRQGLLSDVPRLGGLAPHAVALGMFSLTFLLCVWARPFSNRWLNRAAWMLGLTVLFFAQSKTSWATFLLCAAVMLAVRHGGDTWRRLGDPREGTFGIVACLALILAVTAVLAAVLVGDLHSKTEAFLDTAEGAQLLTLTGRDQIWAIAIDEWRANQLFGYGPALFDGDFRLSIGMPQATSAHNQFLDTLARSGSIGAAGLVLYAVVLLVLSLRYAKATGGLSLALFLVLALRSVSEVPLLIFGYGTELFTHLLLLITLASAAAAPRVEVLTAPVRRTNYRVAS